MVIRVRDWNTPSYIVKEEIKRFAMRIETGKRALKFEEKIKRVSQTTNYLKSAWR